MWGLLANALINLELYAEAQQAMIDSGQNLADML